MTTGISFHPDSAPGTGRVAQAGTELDQRWNPAEVQAEVIRHLTRDTHFPSLVSACTEALQDQLPANCGVVAHTILREHGFRPEQTDPNVVVTDFIEKQLRRERGVFEALNQLGLDPLHVRIETHHGVSTGTIVRSFVDYSPNQEAPGDKRVQVTFAGIESDASYHIPPEYRPKDQKSKQQAFHRLAGFAREVGVPPSQSLKLTEHVQAREDAALKGSLFEHIWREGGVSSGIVAYVKQLNERLNARAERDEDLESYGVIRDGILSPTLRGELRAIKVELEGPLTDARLKHADLAEEVVRRIRALREGNHAFISSSVVADDVMVDTLATIRRGDLFAPVEARPPSPDKFIAVLNLAKDHPDYPYETTLRNMLHRRFGDGYIHEGSGDARLDAYQRAIRFMYTELEPIREKSADSRLPVDAVLEAVSALAEAGNGRPLVWPIYYGFFKTLSFSRTGSASGAVGFGEYEMLRRFAELARTAHDSYGINLKFVIADESSGVVGNLGVTQELLEFNYDRGRKYLEQIGASDLVEIRSFAHDLREALGKSFDDNHARAIRTIQTSGGSAGHRVYVLMTALSREILQDELGLTNEQLVDFQRNLLAGNEDTDAYPAAVVEYVQRVGNHFDALMALRPLAVEFAKLDDTPAPEFSPSALGLGVTRKSSRLSIDPCPDFVGKAVLPLHGIPCYSGGNFAGHVPLWKVLAYPELFHVYLNERHQVLFVKYEIEHAVSEEYVRRQT